MRVGPGVDLAPFQQTPEQFYGTALLAGLGHLDKHVYGGTVPDEEVARRRRRNQAARRARRVHRLAAR